MKILVCLAGSELSQTILPTVGGVAKSAKADVQVVHVVDLRQVHATVSSQTAVEPRDTLGACAPAADVAGPRKTRKSIS